LNVDSITLESANEEDIWYDAISNIADLDSSSQNLSYHRKNFETVTVNATRNVRKRANQSCYTPSPAEKSAEQDEPSCESLIHDLPIFRPQPYYVDDP
jgi:hypothetical protein